MPMVQTHELAASVSFPLPPADTPLGEDRVVAILKGSPRGGLVMVEGDEVGFSLGRCVCLFVCACV